MIVLNNVYYIFDLLLGTWQIQTGLLVAQICGMLDVTHDDLVTVIDSKNAMIALEIRWIIVLNHILAIIYLLSQQSNKIMFPYIMKILSTAVPMVSSMVFIAVFEVQVTIGNAKDVYFGQKTAKFENSIST